MPSLGSFKSPSEAFPHLCGLVMRQGRTVGSRQGQPTKELTMVHFSVGASNSLSVNTEGRGVSFPAQIAEMMWILSGRNDIDWLSRYLPRAKDFSDDGRTWRGGYGPRLRRFGTDKVDQLAHVIALLKEDPTTRRAVFNIYDPEVDSAPGKDVPCNNWVHFLAREGKLDANVAIRSNDLMWGWSGINSFEWATLLQLVAHLTGLEVGRVHYSISSLHLYERHWEKADRMAEKRNHFRPAVRPVPGFNMTRVSRPDPLPTEPIALLDLQIKKWFAAEEQIRKQDTDKSLMQDTMTRMAIMEVDDAQLRSWLWVLYSWNTGRPVPSYLADSEYERLLTESPTRKPEKPRVDGFYLLKDGAQNPPTLQDLDKAVKLEGVTVGFKLSSEPGDEKPEEASVITAHQYEKELKEQAFRARLKAVKAGLPADAKRFADELSALHAEKNAAYGDSWMKRGEQMSIMANLARKVDRLGANGGGDTALDTAVDLFIYCVKYRLWLCKEFDLLVVPGGGKCKVRGKKHVAQVEYLINVWTDVARLYLIGVPGEDKSLEDKIKADFKKLETSVKKGSDDRQDIVQDLTLYAARLACHLWSQENAPAHADRNATRSWKGYGE